MKLYTEEEIVSFLKKEFADEINAETFMENLTPIQLPSDEEIEQHAEESNCSLEFDTGFLYGAKWMRLKIKGGNK
jgi:elongation factor P hydroxylase